MLGFMYCIYFSLFRSCIFEVFGGGVKVACWCQLMVQTRAADQPVSQRGSNIAQQSSGITRGGLFIKSSQRCRNLFVIFLATLVSFHDFILFFTYPSLFLLL